MLSNIFAAAGALVGPARRLYLVLGLLLLGLPVRAQSLMGPEDAIREGLKNNFNIRIARNDARAARNRAGLGTANFLPTATLAGSYGQTRNRTESNSPFSFGDTDEEALSAQAGFSWTLFDGFLMFAEKGRFNALAALGEAQARNTIESAVVGILVAYFDLVQQRQLLKTASENVEISRTRFEKTRLRNDLGGASSTDVLNARVQVNADSSALLRQELNVLTARTNLNIALGREPEAPIAVVDELTLGALAIDRDGLAEEALARNSTLELARQSLVAAQKGVTSARSAFWPRLSFSGTYVYNDQTQTRLATNPSTGLPYDDITTERRSSNLGLNLSYSLFNGMRDKIAVQNAVIDRKNSELALENARLQIRGLVQQRYDDYRHQMRIVALEMKNTEAARRNLTLQEERFQLGGVTSLDVRDAQVNFIRAQTALIAARFQARISQLRLEQLAGRLSIN